MASEPTTIYAGDTLTWTRTLADYPAPEWVLTYSLVQLGSAITIVAAAAGTDHLVYVPATETANYVPGDYTWSAFVSDALTGLVRHTVERGAMTVQPNPAAGGYDTRSDPQIILDNINAYLKDPQNIKAASYSFQNRSLSRWPLGDLLAWRTQLMSEVKNLQAKERGQTIGRHIEVRFDRA